MIPEPQQTYVLELLQALGPAGADFVVVGAQAMKFVMKSARATKDIDLVLDVVRLRSQDASISETLKRLGYEPVERARTCKFQKAIRGSTEVMRTEFMRPAELKRPRDIRVEVQDGIHARSLTGGSIALVESAIHEVSGRLPDGSLFATSVRVTAPHALVMLKLLALDERYRNIRGDREAVHDREEARTHAADIIAIVTAQLEAVKFSDSFAKQFGEDVRLRLRVLEILGGYFAETTSPGLLVYEEFLVAGTPANRAARLEVGEEVSRAHAMMCKVFGLQKRVETES